MKLNDLLYDMVAEGNNQKKFVGPTMNCFGHWLSAQATLDPTWQHGLAKLRPNDKVIDYNQLGPIWCFTWAEPNNSTFLVLYKLMQTDAFLVYSIRFVKANISLCKSVVLFSLSSTMIVSKFRMGKVKLGSPSG